MQDEARGLLSRWNPWIGLAVAGSVAGILVVLWSEFAPQGEEGAPAPQPFAYETGEFTRVDPALLRYRPAQRIDSRLQQTTAIAVGPEDRIFVGGDRSVHVHARDGTFERALACSGTPRCLDVGADGAVYVGLDARVEVYEPEGVLRRAWDVPGTGSRLTSLDWCAARVHAADYGQQAVWTFRETGETIARFGNRDAGRKAPPFAIPSPYFDLAMGLDGRLRVVNPGKHWIGAFSVEGQLDFTWGESSFRWEGFSGCCNPAHFALLPDGGFVTSEKGLPRLKVHGRDGKFLGVVAGPESLGEDPSARDVAVDSTGRVLVLDPATRSVRVYAPAETKK